MDALGIDVRGAIAPVEAARSGDETQALSAIAHDLRAPLAQIADLADLAEEAPNETERRELLAEVRRIAVRSRSVLDAMLGLYCAGITPDRQTISLEDAAEAAAEARKAEIADLGGEIRLTGRAEAPGDRLLIEQVFVNLIDNAIKFRGASPPIIRVAICQMSQAAEITVSDHGVGIPPSEAERVFLSAFRDPSAAPSPGYGIGLGLCAKIVAAHGGAISAERPRCGESTRIVIVLPR